MALRIHQNGLGAALGDPLVVNAALYVAHRVVYVHSVTGADDSAVGRGYDTLRPYATLAYALLAAPGSDMAIYVLLDGHSEVIEDELVVDDPRVIVGAGSANGMPTAKLRMEGSTTRLRLNADGCQLRNVWVEETQDGPLAAPVEFYGDHCAVRGCRFTLSGHMSRAINVSGVDGFVVENTQFVNTATEIDERPYRALNITGSDNVRLRSVVFDGGTVGFAENAFNSDTAMFLQAESVSLLRGADASIALDSTGWFQVTQATGSARVEWPMTPPGGPS
jgi:hypothetical protein